jgi:hypothetical protein
MKFLVIGPPISYNRGIVALKMMILGFVKRGLRRINNMKSKYLLITSSTRHETIFCLVIYIYSSTFALPIDFGTIARFFIWIRIFEIQHCNCNILGI